MRKISVNETKNIDGGKTYICTTRTLKYAWNYQYIGTCGHRSYAKWTLRYHFLFSHSGKNCTYSVK